MASYGAQLVGTVETLWRYPVKSMNGEELVESVVTEGGMLGDRAYALIDSINGKIASAKHPRKWHKLIELGAAFTEPPRVDAPLPPVRITWPSGAQALSNEAHTSARLAETVGRQVTLTAARPEAISVERLDPLAEKETLLDIGALMMGDRFSDYAPVHLLTLGTLAWLSALSPECSFDVRRFRPNIVIDAGDCSGSPENSWVGRTVAIGENVRLRISDPTPRCAIPTLGQGRLLKDPKVLRTLVEHNRLPVSFLDGELLPCAGVYAFVLQGGAVQTDDSVWVE